MSTSNPQAVLLDIEGTVGAASFVKDVLFPYARSRLATFVHEHIEDLEVARTLEQARALMGAPDADIDTVTSTILAWSDTDQKVAPLKTLQGLIWRTGYEDGSLRAHLYDDAVDAMRRWEDQRITIAIFSSGSITAQKLYFCYSIAGDLTPLITAYFDTNTGPKKEASSYASIAATLGVEPASMRFFSDTVAELSAARDAGYHTVRIDRALTADTETQDEIGPVWGSFDPAESI